MWVVAEMVGSLLREPVSPLSTGPVLTFMTAGAQGNQVGVVIVALLAAELLVIHLQVFSGSRILQLQRSRRRTDGLRVLTDKAEMSQQNAPRKHRTR